MILERRVIVFPRADFIDAIRRYGEKVSKTLPDDAIEGMQFDPAQDAALVISFPRTPQGVDRRYVFSREDVGQALTNYCRDHKVPLPSKAAKQVEKFKDGAALSMQLGNPGLHVMIVDDQDVMRSIIKKLLTKANPAQVIEARNGIEALELLRSGEADPDVIICDLHMEKMDGATFLKELRGDATNRNNRKPVLILTGDKNQQAHELTRQVGASKVLTKPIGPDDLIREIMLVRGYFEAAK